MKLKHGRDGIRAQTFNALFRPAWITPPSIPPAVQARPANQEK